MTTTPTTPPTPALPAGQQRVLDLMGQDGYSITSKISQGKTKYQIRHPSGSEEGATTEIRALIKRGQLVHGPGGRVTTPDRENARKTAEKARWDAGQARRKAAQAAPTTFDTPEDERLAVSKTLDDLRRFSLPGEGSIIDMKNVTRGEVEALRLHAEGSRDTAYQKSVRVHQYRTDGTVMPYGRVARDGQLVDNPDFQAANSARPKTSIEKGWQAQLERRARVEANYAKTRADFEGKSRAWLLKEAGRRGITVPRGTPEDKIIDDLAWDQTERATIKSLPAALGVSNVDLANEVRARLADKFASARNRDRISGLVGITAEYEHGFGATKTGTAHPAALRAALDMAARERLDVRTREGQDRVAHLLTLPGTAAPEDQPGRLLAGELGYGDKLSTGGFANTVASVIHNENDNTVTVHTFGVMGGVTTLPADREVKALVAERRGMGGSSQLARRSLRELEDERQERIRTAFATMDTAPSILSEPGGGRPRLYDLLFTTPTSHNEWSGGATPDVTKVGYQNKIISGGGAFNGVEARGEIYAPATPDGPYRARIFDWNDGTTIDTFESMDANEAFRWADQVHDVRRGKAMPRKAGVTAEYSVKKVKAPRDAVVTSMTGHHYQVLETLNTGQVRVVSKQISEANAGREVSRLNRLERERLGIPEATPPVPVPAPPRKSTPAVRRPAAPKSGAAKAADAAKAAARPATAPRGSARARKGDLILVERTDRDYSAGTGAGVERISFHYGRVASADRDGVAKTYEDAYGGNPVPIKPTDRVRVMSAENVDVDAVMEASRRHTYPGTEQAKPFDSLEEAKAIAAPHAGDQAAKLAAKRAAAPVGRNPMRLKPGDMVRYRTAGGSTSDVEVIGPPEEVRRTLGRGTEYRVPARLPGTGRSGFITFRKSESAQVIPPGGSRRGDTKIDTPSGTGETGGMATTGKIPPGAQKVLDQVLSGERIVIRSIRGSSDSAKYDVSRPDGYGGANKTPQIQALLDRGLLVELPPGEGGSTADLPRLVPASTLPPDRVETLIKEGRARVAADLEARRAEVDRINQNISARAAYNPRQRAVADLGTSFTGNPYAKMPALEALTEADYRGMTDNDRENAQFLLGKIGNRTGETAAADARRKLATLEAWEAGGGKLANTDGARLAAARGITPDEQMLDQRIVKTRSGYAVRQPSAGQSAYLFEGKTKREAEDWMVRSRELRAGVAARENRAAGTPAQPATPPTGAVLTPERRQELTRKLQGEVQTRIGTVDQAEPARIAAAARAENRQALAANEDSDRLVDRHAALLEEQQRAEQLQREWSKVVAELDAAAADPARGDDERSMARELADRYRGNEAKNAFDPGKAAELAKLDADITALRSEQEHRDRLNAYDGERQDRIGREAEAAFDARMAEAYAPARPPLDDSRYREARTAARVAALRRMDADNAADVKTNADRRLAEVMTPEGRQAAGTQRRWRERAAYDASLNADGARSKAERLEVDAKTEAARASGAAIRQQEATERYRQEYEQRPEIQDARNWDAVTAEVRRQMGPGVENIEATDKAAISAERRRVKKEAGLPSESAIRALPREQRSIAEDAVRAIDRSAKSRLVEERNIRALPIYEGLLGGGMEIRPKVRAALERQVKDVRDTLGAPARRDAERDLAIAAWKAVRGAPAPSGDWVDWADIPADLKVGLTREQEDALLSVFRAGGLSAARKFVAALRGQ